MFTTAYTYTDPETGAEDLLHVQGGQWVGEECVFEFSARGRASSGVVRADWRRHYSIDNSE